MSQTRELAAAIDIGTSWTRAILGSFTADNKLDVLAFGEVQTQGVRNGVVVNIDEAAESIGCFVNVNHYPVTHALRLHLAKCQYIEFIVCCKASQYGPCPGRADIYGGC